MNVFQEIVGAVKGVKAYPEFLKNKKGKIFGYTVLVVTIFFLLASIRGFIGVGIFFAGFGDMIRDNVPEFELANGTFYIEEPFYLEEEGIYVDIDTDDDIVFYLSEDDWKYQLVDYDSVIIADSEGAVIKNNGQVQVMEWPGEWNFDREDVIGFQPIMVICVVVFYIFAFIFDVAVYFFNALILALIGMIIASTQKNKMTFGQIYIVAIYAKTAPLLIKGLIKLTGLSSVPVLGGLLGMGLWVLVFVYICLAMAEIKKQSEVPATPQVEYPYTDYNNF